MTSLMSQVFGKDFDKFFIGFDDQINQMIKFHDEVAKHIPNYPPFNIIKNNENSYTIEIAVAGFGQQDIDIEMDNGNLIVRGKLQNAEDPLENEIMEKFLVKGIANRAFTRAFKLNDEIEVKDAEIFNGMLRIALERLIPEHKQPKKVPVKSAAEKSKKQLLNENV